MCIVIDTNKLGEFFETPASDDAAPIHKWLRGGHRGTLGAERHESRRIVFGVGGRFGEIGVRLRRRLQDLVQAGRATAMPAAALDQDVRALQGTGQLASNDPHILALARASGARLLYTADKDLIADFKNPRIVSHPRGKVYSGAANARLLAAASCGPRRS